MKIYFVKSLWQVNGTEVYSTALADERFNDGTNTIRPWASYRPCYTPGGEGRQGALDSPGARLP